MLNCLEHGLLVHKYAVVMMNVYALRAVSLQACYIGS
jgi:hypothetical protein